MKRLIINCRKTFFIVYNNNIFSTINLIKEASMKRNPWLKYLIYIVLIFVMIYLRDYVGGLNAAYFKREFRINFYLMTINLLILIIIGLLLGVEHFISETRKDGVWKINFPKIILLGLPSVYFSLTNFLIYINNEFLRNIIAFPLMKLLMHGSGYVSLFQLILGYVIITSFYKCNKEVAN